MAAPSVTPSLSSLLALVQTADVPSIAIDYSALESFVCPAFDEASAIELDDDVDDVLLQPHAIADDSNTCEAERSSAAYSAVAAMTLEPRQLPLPYASAFESLLSSSFERSSFELTLSEPAVVESTQVLSSPSPASCSFQILLESDVAFLSPVHLRDNEERIDASCDVDHASHNAQQHLLLSDPLQRLCRYRKGKCRAPRTRKKNGALHTYCAYHRARSVANQKSFDARRRSRKRVAAHDIRA